VRLDRGLRHDKVTPLQRRRQFFRRPDAVAFPLQIKHEFQRQTQQYELQMKLETIARGLIPRTASF
jgi:hypothetical protein